MLTILMSRLSFQWLCGYLPLFLISSITPSLSTNNLSIINRIVGYKLHKCSAVLCNVLSKGTTTQGVTPIMMLVGKDQETAQSEKDSHSKNQGGKKPN